MKLLTLKIVMVLTAEREVLESDHMKCTRSHITVHYTWIVTPENYHE